MDKRIDWIDSARGIAVLLVIWGHIDGGSIFTRAFYCFHVPLLFWISGFLFNAEPHKFDLFLIKKIKTIALPCMLYSTIVIILGIFIFRDVRYVQLIPQIIMQIKSWPLWYMACLFLLNIIGYFVLKRIHKKSMQILIVLLLAGCGLLYNTFVRVGLPWNMDIAPMAFPFFYFGFLEKDNMKSNKGILIKINQSAHNSTWIGFILLLVSIGMGFLNKELSNAFYTFDMYSGHYNIAPISYLSAFIGIYAVCLICSRFKSKILTHVGKRSIVYFAFHFNIFIPLIKSLIGNVALPNGIQPFLYFAFTCLMSEMTYYLISKFKYRQYLAVK